jgi:hypothetical protein
MRASTHPPRGTRGLIEHPGRNLQPAIAGAARQAAAANLSASLVDYLMNVNQAPRPGMPRVKKLARLGPVGVLSSRCTTKSGRIDRCPKTRRRFVRFSSPELSTHGPCLADFTIITSGFSFSVHTGLKRTDSDDLGVYWRSVGSGTQDASSRCASSRLRCVRNDRASNLSLDGAPFQPPNVRAVFLYRFVGAASA